MHNNSKVGDFTPEGSKQSYISGRSSFKMERINFCFLVFLKSLYTGFRKLHFVGAFVTIFGSARFQETHPYYEIARNIGRQLAQIGFTIMTGGGPGIMEAANRGAKEAGGSL
ncbi:LOG family protein [Flavipsychrobacter stenotrophus]|uniref:LOG family protein n=1 Tax=Flavipsychrobacter stenotrophus TaxID=2077091 RepID=UPI001F0B91E5|nr:hypothetical protein [Flavipsychrobacter stenotrophus]